MSEDADNLVLRLLREMRQELREVRAEMATKADLNQLSAETKAELSDLRHDVSEGFTETTKALAAITHRLEEGDRVAARVTALDKRVSNLEGRRGS